MNHNVTLGIVVTVAAIALSAVALAVPQHVLAYGHYNHNSIKVDQQMNQLNACTGTPVEWVSSTTCQNFGENQANISK